ncbi:MAG: VWA domain-containing protein [Albidovulum sp.]|uniref:pilus assembly protein TadG-related protein n=1 Tax=Albidovulum sp. TaxID=1872424 RepID=UPI003CC39877
MTMLARMGDKTRFNKGAVYAALSRFRREEDGSLIVFGLFCFIIMLLLAGVSLDVMRFEERRTILQATIDRAALASADLQQTLDPKDVVKDYFRKAGLEPPADDDIVVTEGSFGESRRVKISASEQMPTWFMRMVGVNDLKAPAASTAEESVGQIEISLILDVSGSMGRNSRLVNLKPAAKNFVDQMFKSAEPGKISISIVPYSTQVSMDAELASYFNLSGEHNSSRCIEFEDSLGDFSTTAVQFGNTVTDRTYQRNGHFDPFYRNSYTRLLNCIDQSYAEILPFSGDSNALKAKIDSLEANGNTSIDIGMKWGAALLDPSMQDVVDGMIADGSLPSEFSDRPYAFDDNQTLKIIVLMTDGQNTTEYRLEDDFASGDSRLYTNTWYQANYPDSKNQYSYYDPNRSGNKYYSFRTDSWRSQPYGDASGDNGDAVRMTWPQVWNDMTIRYFSDDIVYDATNSSSQRNYFRNAPYNGYWSAKDSLTKSMCNAAKTQDVKIYSIAFEAPSSGQTLLRDCASSDANYYNVAGLDIESAFSGIANSINKLRLTH